MRAAVSLVASFLLIQASTGALANPLHDIDKQTTRKDVQKLIRSGHDIDEPNDEDSSPLLIALGWRNYPVAYLLLESGANVNYRSPRGFDALYLALQNADLVSELLERGASPNNKYFPLKRSILHIAATENRIDVLKLILSRRIVDVNIRDALGRTPLHVATNWLNAEIVKILLLHGADVNARDNQRLTPIHGVDTEPGSRAPTELMTILIKAGADVNAKDAWGVTPLYAHAYLSSYEGHRILAEQLLSSGADINVKDSHGHTALHTAANQGNTEALPFLDLLIASGIKIDEPDNFGLTALHHAAFESNVSIAKYLIQKGANVDAQDMFGDTVLHHSVQRHYLYSTFQTEMVRILLAANADVGKHNHFGITPLHRSAYWRNASVAQILLEGGADPNARDNGAIRLYIMPRLGCAEPRIGKAQRQRSLKS